MDQKLGRLSLMMKVILRGWTVKFQEIFIKQTWKIDSRESGQIKRYVCVTRYNEYYKNSMAWTRWSNERTKGTKADNECSGIFE